jgi:hypothetical protein
MEKIILLINNLTNNIKNLEQTFLLRYNKNNNPNKNKLNFKNTLYASLCSLKCDGIVSATSILEEEQIVTVSKNALIKKRNSEKTYQYLKKLNDDLLSSIYDPSNNFIKKYNYKLSKNKTFYIDDSKSPDKNLFINSTSKRFIGCDGFQLNVNKNAINNNDIKSSKSKNYGVILTSSIFDIMREIPINYLSVPSNEINFNKKKVNETTGLLKQFDKLNENDIVVMDRWYFDKYLHKKFILKNIGYIFRVQDNAVLFKNMHYGCSKIVELNGTLVQLFKYKIKNHQYNILTSITEKISIAEIKALYWKRWKIETNNKKFKYDILSSNIRSKNYISIHVDIECVKFIALLSSIIEYIGKENLRENKKFHSKNCLGVLFRKLLKIIIYEPLNYNEICRFVGIIYKKIIQIVYNRSCIRARVSPSTKWNENGNRFGNKKE